MSIVTLGDIAEINPSRQELTIDDSLSCSFIPMEYVDEITGRIEKTGIRKVGDVRKGYTSFQNGDVLFAKITPCMENGKVAIANGLENGIGFGSTEFHVIRPSKYVIPEWIYYFLRQQSVRNQAVTWFRGTAGQQRVPPDFLKTVRLPLPPVEDQKRITNILHKADRIRRLRRYSHRLSDSYLQSVFLEMFGDETKHPQTHLEDLLVENPKNGLYLPSEYYGAGIPIIRIDAFYAGFLTRIDELKRVRATNKQEKEFEVINGDILINRVNSLEYLGKCAYVTGLREPTIFESNMMRIRVDPKKTNPEFITCYLSSKNAYKQIRKMAKEAVNQASINQTDVKAVTLSFPPLDVQNKFKLIYQKQRNLITHLEEGQRQAEHLFLLLLYRAFSPVF